MLHFINGVINGFVNVVSCNNGKDGNITSLTYNFSYNMCGIIGAFSFFRSDL